MDDNATTGRNGGDQSSANTACDCRLVRKEYTAEESLSWREREREQRGRAAAAADTAKLFFAAEGSKEEEM